MTANVRLSERDAELSAQGLTADEVGAELEISTATLYNWRQRFGKMSADEAVEYVEPARWLRQDLRAYSTSHP